MFAEVAKHVKEQIGLDLIQCDHFEGDGTYVNAILNERCWDSQDFMKLSRLAEYSTLVRRVEPNGVNRVAIFIK